jgi:hypothetical protein
LSNYGALLSAIQRYIIRITDSVVKLIAKLTPFICIGFTSAYSARHIENFEDVFSSTISVGVACGTYGGQDCCIQGWWGHPSIGKPKSRWKIIFKWIFKKWDAEAWIGLFCLRIGTGGGHL